MGELGLIPGLGRSPGEGNGNLLQYSCLENSMDRGAWQAERLNTFTFTFAIASLNIFQVSPDLILILSQFCQVESSLLFLFFSWLS